MSTGARRYRITGRVQGVFFRASAREQAERLGIAGYAKNLPDGSVEVLAGGSHDALASFETWLRQGPKMADVESVSAEPAEAPAGSGFRTG